MKYAIIAAGEGSRLAQEGMPMPKPLVPLLGEPMIARLIRIFRSNDAEEIVIVVNALNSQTEKYVRHMQEETKPEEAPIRLVVKTTPSSMHSFYELSPFLRNSAFCLTTVDTIFREDDFARYINAFNTSNADGMMAVTDYIDDEKPLYVVTDDALNITAFVDNTPLHVQYISGGIYCLRSAAIDVLDKCIEQGVSRMRNYQRALIENNLNIKAYPFSKILDVDHSEDINKAEAFIAERG